MNIKKLENNTTIKCKFCNLLANYKTEEAGYICSDSISKCPGIRQKIKKSLLENERITCPKCNKKFSKSVIKRHKNVCGKYKPRLFSLKNVLVEKDGKFNCPKCKRIFSSIYGVCSHFYRVHTDEGKYDSFKNYNPENRWNKGLTKETDNRIKKISQKLSEFYKKNSGTFKYHKHTVESKKKISEAAKRGIENGTWHTGNSWVGTVKYISKFAGIVHLMGNWELEYAKYLDDNNINWKLNQKRFKYVSKHLPTKSGYYKPDFYLIDKNEYVEIKGYETEIDHDKWKQFPHKLKILRGKDLLALGLKITL